MICASVVGFICQGPGSCRAKTNLMHSSNPLQGQSYYPLRLAVSHEMGMVDILSLSSYTSRKLHRDRIKWALRLSLGLDLLKRHKVYNALYD